MIYKCKDYSQIFLFTIMILMPFPKGLLASEEASYSNTENRLSPEIKKCLFIAGCSMLATAAIVGITYYFSEETDRDESFDKCLVDGFDCVVQTPSELPSLVSKSLICAPVAKAAQWVSSCFRKKVEKDKESFKEYSKEISSYKNIPSKVLLEAGAYKNFEEFSKRYTYHSTLGSCKKNRLQFLWSGSHLSVDLKYTKSSLKGDLVCDRVKFGLEGDDEYTPYAVHFDGPSPIEYDGDGELNMESEIKLEVEHLSEEEIIAIVNFVMNYREEYALFTHNCVSFGHQISQIAQIEDAYFNFIYERPDIDFIVKALFSLSDTNLEYPSVGVNITKNSMKNIKESELVFSKLFLRYYDSMACGTLTLTSIVLSLPVWTLYDVFVVQKYNKN